MRAKCFGLFDIPLPTCETCSDISECKITIIKRLFNNFGVCGICDSLVCIGGKYSCDKQNELTIDHFVKDCDCWDLNSEIDDFNKIWDDSTLMANVLGVLENK